MNRRGNFGAKPGGRRQFDHSTVPAHLTLEQYEAADPRVVAELVAEFGKAGALRLLNGKPPPAPVAVPFDPALLAPAGAKGVPKSQKVARRQNVAETSGSWS